MNAFYIYHYTGRKFEKLEGTPVFPLNFSDMLDESLDEMYVTVYNSPVKNYKTTDVFKICFYETELVKTAYFVLADDRAFEYPVGSGKYKHELFLIEPTKLLEGIVCQSLTFTNVMGRGYDVLQQPAIPDITGSKNTEGFVKWCERHFTTPQEMGSTCTFPSLQTIVTAMIDTSSADGYASGNDWYCRVTSPSLNITEYDTASEEDISVVFEESGVYMIDYSYNDSALGSACTVTFYIASLHNTHDSKPWSITDMTCRVLELAEPLFFIRFTASHPF